MGRFSSFFSIRTLVCSPTSLVLSFFFLHILESTSSTSLTANTGKLFYSNETPHRHVVFSKFLGKEIPTVVYIFRGFLYYLSGCIESLPSRGLCPYASVKYCHSLSLPLLRQLCLLLMCVLALCAKQLTFCYSRNSQK